MPDKKLRKARVEINTSDRPSHRDCLFAVGEGGSPQTRTSRGLEASVNFSQFTFPFARYRTKKLAPTKPRHSYSQSSRARSFSKFQPGRSYFVWLYDPIVEILHPAWKYFGYKIVRYESLLVQHQVGQRASGSDAVNLS